MVITVMNRILIIVLCCVALQAAEAPAAPAPRTVYLLSMGNGLDQFLASRLISMHVLEVVADAKKADAILTDRLGQGFEARLDELFPPPPPPLKPKESKDKEASVEEVAGTPPPVGQFGNTARGRGNVFLVDAKSRRVLWSTFITPADTTPDQLDKTAGQIAERLKKDLAGKKAGKKK